MEGDKPYTQICKIVNFVGKRAQMRILAIRQTARFVEIVSHEQNSQLKRGAVHTIIPSCQVSVQTKISSIKRLSVSNRIFQKQTWEEWSRNRPT